MIPDQFKALAKPFPKEAYREVKFGRQFTTIDAYHVIERLTEVFGLMGLGWGVEDLRYEIHEQSCAAHGTFWYRLHDDKGVIHAVGDSQVIKGHVAEAYKKATTNLISKAASYLGVGLSIYQGKGIDDPYLDRAEVAKAPPPKQPSQRIVYNVTEVYNGSKWDAILQYITEHEHMCELVLKDLPNGSQSVTVVATDALPKLARYAVKA